MLGLPIYLRGSVYYFHTRINGKQVKKSLNTSNKTLAMVRACQILELKLIKKMYSIDLGKMIFSADGQEDHERLMEALSVIKGGLVDGAVKKPSVDLPSTMNGLRLGALLDKMLNLKTFKECIWLPNLVERTINPSWVGIVSYYRLILRSDLIDYKYKKKKRSICSIY